MNRVVWACGVAFLLSLLTTGCQEEEFTGPTADVVDTNIKLDLPSVPQFNMPSPYPDGTHPVAEMRLKGNKFLDQDVKVKGYVVWVYDCATAIRTPEMTDDEVQKILSEEPERCSRPNIYIADKAEDPRDRGVWVVDIPRKPRKDEEKVLPKEVLAEMENAPEFEVGQEVVLTGKWSQKSPAGFVKSEGLLVFAGVEFPGMEEAATE